MSQNSIFLPVLAMVALTLAVWIQLYRDRIGEIQTRRIVPQDLANSRQMATQLEKINASDNFKNLFELPVLFYVFCLTIFVTRSTTPVFVAGAWLYVLLRVAHSVIHCTYNNILHRFTVYVISSLVLFVLWFILGIQIVSTP
jgi:hypothetical protein